MALDPANIGLSVPAASGYLVGREKVREFAIAVGETSPLCHDLVAAQAAGYSDLVAPTTFPIIASLEVMKAVAVAPPVNVDWSRVVHSDQRFAYTRPVVAGDELYIASTVEDIKSLAGNDMITMRGDVTDASGAPVLQVWTTLAVRGEG